jgi:GTP-eEF1A C-terminal domain-like
MVLPSGRTSRVKALTTYDGELARAFPPMSVTVCLQDEIDISRGDMLVPPSHPPHVSRRIDARIVWMHETPLELGRSYLVKHTTQTVRAAVESVRYRVNINTLEKEPAVSLGLNDIGAVVLETQRPLFYDPYRRNRVTGSFVLIDPVSNGTVAAGLITGREARQVQPHGQNGYGSRFSANGHRITRIEQQSRNGHRAATLWLEAGKDVGYIVERRLFDRDCRVHALSVDEENGNTPRVARILNDAGLIVILVASQPAHELRERTREAVGNEQFLAIDPSRLTGDPERDAEAILGILEEQGLNSLPFQGD